MSDFHKQRNIRLINNVIGHEVGHLVASLLLNEVQEEPKAEKIKIKWIEQLQHPSGQIEYSRKEGVNSWEFPADLNLCYYTILSLYSGCIWEKYFDSIFHRKELTIQDIETCYQSSGHLDVQTIGIINNKHIKMSLTKKLTEEKIILPYVNILNKIDEDIREKIYDYLKFIASKIDSYFNQTGILEYAIELDEFAELEEFIKKEFIDKIKEALVQIISDIKKIINLE